MKSTKQNTSGGTIELLVTMPWADVKKMYEAALDEAVKHAEIPGFRKGKAPKKTVEEKLDKSTLYEEVLKTLIPKAYEEAAKEHKIKPIISPKVELKEAEEGKDWVIRLLTCEAPEVKLGDYKKAVKELKAGKATKIWTPDQDKNQKEEKKEDRKPTLDELLTAVYEVVDVEVPELLLEQEVNRMLSNLIDQTKKLGLTVEQYLASSQKNSDSIRQEYQEQANRTLAMEFALEKLADKEGILISDDDIDNVIKGAKDEKEKKALSSQRYYLASVLRRQKTIDYLASL